MQAEQPNELFKLRGEDEGEVWRAVKPVIAVCFVLWGWSGGAV